MAVRRSGAGSEGDGRWPRTAASRLGAHRCRALRSGVPSCGAGLLVRADPEGALGLYLLWVSRRSRLIYARHEYMWIAYIRAGPMVMRRRAVRTIGPVRWRVARANGPRRQRRAGGRGGRAGYAWLARRSPIAAP